MSLCNLTEVFGPIPTSPTPAANPAALTVDELRVVDGIEFLVKMVEESWPETISLTVKVSELNTLLTIIDRLTSDGARVR